MVPGPGYHMLITLSAKLLGMTTITHGPNNHDSINKIRTISLFYSLLFVGLFFLLAKRVSENSPEIATLQCYFLPILFPYFFLVYTDVVSALLVLLSLYALLNKKNDLAGIMVILSMVVRQNNIIWLFFMCLFVYFEYYQSSPGLAFSKQGLKIKLDNNLLKQYIKECRWFFIGIFFFLIFVILNKGVALGDRANHPPFSFFLGNIYFILFLFFFLFLPTNISNFSRIVQYIKKHKQVIFFVIVGFVFYLYTFNITHPYNHGGSLGEHNYFFLRNVILRFFTSNIYMRLLFYLAVAYSILSLMVTKLSRKSFYLIYPITFLYLVPSWLIEQRYYIIPFVLFLLFKEKSSKLVELLTVVCYMALSAYFFHGIVNGKFFL
jgi:alpha-1,2-glucosyltransferase